VTYTDAQGRQQILDTLARATEQLAAALGALGAAYEQLDERTADRLEEELFRPVQLAYGRAQRVHAGFAQRSGLAGRAFAQPPAGSPSQGARGLIDRGLGAVASAEDALATLQDSMLPVEAGDQELRAGLSDVRERLTGLPARARELVRVLGR